MGTVALLTDFGERDGFVGMMKGAILRLAPSTPIIDITHQMESFDIKSAAFLLQKSVRFYPEGTVFVAVVDPGVGSTRRIIAARAGEYFFVAPDNGILSYVFADLSDREIVSLENLPDFLGDTGSTFHGRDIMAPAAARLATGSKLSELGPRLDSYCYLKMPNLLKHERSVIGEVVYVDKFGNMISNIARGDLPQGMEFANLVCTVGDKKGIRFASHYDQANGLAAIISGFGTVEVFLNRGRAASQFAEPLGTAVAVEE